MCRILKIRRYGRTDTVEDTAKIQYTCITIPHSEGFVKDTVEERRYGRRYGEDTVQWRFCERYGRRYSICEEGRKIRVEDTVIIPQDLLMSNVLTTSCVLHCPHLISQPLRTHELRVICCVPVAVERGGRLECN